MILLAILIHATGAADSTANAQKSASPTVAAKAETSSSPSRVVGNTDSKRYHLPGTPYYNKVNKSHRIYFNSEQEAIDNGYYKSGTRKDSLGRPSPKREETVKSQTSPEPAAPVTPEKTSPDASQKNEVKPEMQTPAAPGIGVELLKPTGENTQDKTVKTETPVAAPAAPSAPVTKTADTLFNYKIVIAFIFFIILFALPFLPAIVEIIRKKRRRSIPYCHGLQQRPTLFWQVFQTDFAKCRHRITCRASNKRGYAFQKRRYSNNGVHLYSRCRTD